MEGYIGCRKDYMTAPGIGDPIEANRNKAETAICKAFNVMPEVLRTKGRKTALVMPKHFYRFVLASFVVYKEPDKRNEKNMAQRFNNPYKEENLCAKYTIREIGEMTSCDHATVLHSIKIAYDLIDTNVTYRDIFDQIFSKMNHEYIRMPRRK